MRNLILILVFLWLSSNYGEFLGLLLQLISIIYVNSFLCICSNH
jgi:hypothetical protein